MNRLYVGGERAHPHQAAWRSPPALSSSSMLALAAAPQQGDWQSAFEPAGAGLEFKDQEKWINACART